MEANASTSQRKVTLREWFVGNYCEETAVDELLAVQSCTCGGREAQLTSMFHFISELGSGAFYCLLIPIFVWSGYEHEGAYICFLLSLGLYITDCLKDTFSCPRPPSPPVRRGGSASHALEYGWPSTHTALASILSWEIGKFFVELDETYMYPCAVVGITYTVLIALSRMYLGLHWLGDVIGGFAVFIFVALCDAAFLRQLFMYFLDHFARYPYFFVWLAGHLLVVFHAAPRDPCPCFVDSCRFVGADIGAVVGVWCRKRHAIPVAGAALKTHSAPGTFFSLVFNQAFAVRFVVGIILIGVMDVTISASSKRLFKPVMRVLSGSLNLGKFQPIYAFFCCAVGVLLGKEVNMTGIGASSKDPAEFKEKTDQEEREDGGGVALSVTELGGASPIFVAPESVGPAATGRYWSLRNHNHWWEAEVQARVFSYAAIGFAATCIAPYIFEAYGL